MGHTPTKVTREQLTLKEVTVLDNIIEQRGITHHELALNTQFGGSTVDGTLVSLMGHGLVLRSYAEYPPCTYWPTQKAVELT